MTAMNWMDAIPTDMRVSPGPLWASMIGPGQTGRCLGRSVICRSPAPRESSTRKNISSRSTISKSAGWEEQCEVRLGWKLEESEGLLVGAFFKKRHLGKMFGGNFELLQI